LSFDAEGEGEWVSFILHPFLGQFGHSYTHLEAINKAFQNLPWYCQCGHYLSCNFTPHFSVLMQKERRVSFIYFTSISGSIWPFLHASWSYK